MKKSRDIINKLEIPDELTDNDRMTIENNVLLKHIIDNDLKHIWGWLKGLVLAIVGLAVGVVKILFK